MKTLEEVKQEYAKLQGYNDWFIYFKTKMLSYEPEDIELKMNELIELIQQQCLENAYKKAKIESYQPHSTTTFHKVVKESIINENNIVK